MPKVRRCRYDTCVALVEYPNHYCMKHKAHEDEYEDKRNKARGQYFKHYNKANRNRDEQTRNRYNFYKTRQWSQLRRQVLALDYYLCQYCKAHGKLMPDSRTVDHIVAIEVDGNLKDNLGNLATTCRACHKAKTDWEQQYYGTGRNNALKNVPEIHSVTEIAKRIKK